MKIINLTPHAINIYKEEAFVNLVQVNPTTFTADSVEGEAVLVCASDGVARISVATTNRDVVNGILFMDSEYGELIGIPENVESDDVLIVSLPTKSNATASGHPLAAQMVSPWKVIRDSANTSNVLGAIGFTY